jgi:hypothetical protein
MGPSRKPFLTADSPPSKRECLERLRSVAPHPYVGYPWSSGPQVQHGEHVTHSWKATLMCTQPWHWPRRPAIDYLMPAYSPLGICWRKHGAHSNWKLAQCHVQAPGSQPGAHGNDTSTSSQATECTQRFYPATAAVKVMSVANCPTHQYNAHSVEQSTLQTSHLPGCPAAAPLIQAALCKHDWVLT